ncbi:MAG: hypothetical protein GY832_30075 [Chloroflexi bacterium]|nr:hypothetical protein [Chloroflexota bacterium]
MIQAVIGTIIVALTGLLAIVVGALFNAHLNRRQLVLGRQRRAEAISCVLAAELNALIKVGSDRLGFLFCVADGQIAETYPLEIRLQTPSPVVFKQNTEHLGLLAPDVAGDVVRVYADWNLLANVIAVGASGDNNPETAVRRWHDYLAFRESAHKVIRSLGHTPADDMLNIDFANMLDERVCQPDGSP